MEISNEIKAKVFAQYLGQKILNESFENVLEGVTMSEVTRADYVVIMNNTHGDYHGFDECFVQDCKLVLRPLSEITDGDAIEVGMKLGKYDIKDFEIVKIFQYRPRSVEIEYRYKQPNNELAVRDGYAYSAVGFSLDGYNLNIAQYQFLQSRGYDLPHYLLVGKTLKEAGLAIYKSE